MSAKQRAEYAERNRCVFGTDCQNTSKWEVATCGTFRNKGAVTVPVRRFKVCHEHLQPTCVVVANEAPLTVNPIFWNWSGAEG